MTTATDTALRPQTTRRATEVRGQTVAAEPTAHVTPQAHTPAPTRTPATAEQQSSSRRRAAAHGTHQALALGRNGVLAAGSRGPAVESLQRSLNAHGAHLNVDGDFGPKTTAAVRAFQGAHGLAVDGIVGRHTASALGGVAPVAPTHGSGDTSTVAGCARILVNSPNVTFWSGLSSGSDRRNFERLAQGLPAHVSASNHTGPSSVTPNLRMMQALVEMSRHGAIQINALTGGTHSFNSNHYSGTAVDLSVIGVNDADRPLGAHHQGELSASEVTRIAGRHGGARNFETDHIHLDF